MSLAVLRSRALAGMDAPAVSVEVHLANGLPGFTIVGNNPPDTTSPVCLRTKTSIYARSIVKKTKVSDDRGLYAHSLPS